MFAGLPGTGIGGIFYLLLGLWMPVRELWRMATGQPRSQKWHLIRVQSVLTTVMVLAILVTGWAAGWLFWALAPHVLSVAGASTGTAARNVLRLWPVLLTLATLVCVYLALRAVGIILSRHAYRSHSPFEPPSGLSARSYVLWHRVAPARTRSSRQLALIEQALRALDRADQVRQRLDWASFPCSLDSAEAAQYGELARVERESRLLFASLWALMRLDPDIERVDTRAAYPSAPSGHAGDQ